MVTSSNSLPSDTQYHVLPSQNPGLEQVLLSGNPLDCVFPCAPPRGEKTECVNPTGDGIDSICTVPTRGRKESMSTVPTRGGENSVCTVSEYILPSSVTKCIYSRKVKRDLPVGGRLRQFLPDWKKQGCHQLILGLIKDGYKLPFRECPKLSRVPCIVSSYAGFDKQSALLTSIQDLLWKGAIKVLQTPDSVGFYSCLFLVPNPGNCWRPVIDQSLLNKFLAIPKFKMETPESIHASLRKVD